MEEINLEQDDQFRLFLIEKTPGVRRKVESRAKLFKKKNCFETD